MKRILMVLMAMFCMTALGLNFISDHPNFTGALPIDSTDFFTSDTVYFILPRADTTIDTNYFGNIDTLIRVLYPWPSVFDQNSQEWISDSLGVASIHTYDRWAMEDWAFCFFIEELNVAQDVDSVSAHVQYQFPGAPAWTVLYTLFTNIDANANLLTYYPLDLYDNWKLYKNARIRLIITSDSVRVRSWMVFRQMYYHENVPPGQ